MRLRRPRLRRPIVALALLGTSATLAEMPTPTVSRAAAWQAYTRKLARSCGAKHLEWLTPADLLDMIDDFQHALPGEEQHAMEAAREQSCRGVTTGVTCDNRGFVQAAVQLRELDAFVKSVCEQPQQCTQQSVCAEAR